MPVFVTTHFFRSAQMLWMSQIYPSSQERLESLGRRLKQKLQMAQCTGAQNMSQSQSIFTSSCNIVDLCGRLSTDCVGTVAIGSARLLHAYAPLFMQG